MIIVAEKINTSRKSVAEAVERGDADFIVQLARDQVEAGADYVDVNAGTFVEEETRHLCWLVETIQRELSVPLCLDSPNPEALSQAIELHKGEPMINSISLETDRFDSLLPVVLSRPCHLVALCMSRTAMPVTIDERVEVGKELVGKLTEAGFPIERIYVDPLIQPVSVDTRMGVAAVGSIRAISEFFPGVNTICGLSNVSFGLPLRKLINRSFLALAMANGLSSVIIDPTDKELMSVLTTSEMLLGRDEYCEKYIDAYQNDKLVS
jgi:5-methyltetrahydrofolate--homocysteine methyltransferase